MNIAELHGEKSVRALARRLLAARAKGEERGRERETELEAALLRLNPQLEGVAQLEKGTPVLVPEGFGLAAEETNDPRRALSRELTVEAERLLGLLEKSIQESAEQSLAEVERVQAWLKSDQPKQLLRESAELKEVFSAGAAAVRKVTKEQSDTVAAEMRGLETVREELADFSKLTRD
jgi:hypothetical protein